MAWDTWFLKCNTKQFGKDGWNAEEVTNQEPAKQRWAFKKQEEQRPWEDKIWMIPGMVVQLAMFLCLYTEFDFSRSHT